MSTSVSALGIASGSSVRARAGKRTVSRREMLRNSGLQARALASFAFMVTDLLTLIVSYAIVSALFEHRSTGAYWALFSCHLPCAALCVAGFVISGLYPGLSMAPAEELRRYTWVVLLASGLWLAFHVGFLQGALREVWVLAAAIALTVPMLTACRVLARAGLSRTRWWGVPVVVFGGGREGRALIDRLLGCRWIGYKPAVVLDSELKRAGAYRGVPVIPDMSLSDTLAKEHGYSTALIAMRNGKHSGRNDQLLRYTKAFPTYIVFTQHSKYLRLYTSIRDFEGALGLSTTKKLLVPRNVVFDRVLDLTVVAALSVVLLSVAVVLGVLICLDSPGPVFYCQQRLGKDGRRFRLWKFRTMVADAEERLQACVECDPGLKAEWQCNHKLKNDPRITRVGHFLRKSSLDELPQLWNVLKGEMSLIGPRPIIQDEVKHYGARWDTVSSVLPGMTGLWQVSGRSNTGYRDRVELDNYYIQNWSIWLDLYILFKTAWIVVTGKGAY